MRRRLMLRNAESLNNFAPKAPTAGPGSSTGTYAVLDDGTWSFTASVVKWERMPFELKTPIPITQGDVIKLTVVSVSGGMESKQGRAAINSTTDWTDRTRAVVGNVFTVTATNSVTLEKFEWEFNADLTGNGTMKLSLSINDVVIF